MNFHSLAFWHEQQHAFPTRPRPSTNHRTLTALLPLAIGITMALLPPPAGLAQYSWWYLSLFVTVIAGLIVLFLMLRYLFASGTAHVTAPLLLTVAAKILRCRRTPPLSPYGTGPSSVYAGSGFVPGADYWHLGAIFGGYTVLIFLMIGVPILLPSSNRTSHGSF